MENIKLIIAYDGKPFKGWQDNFKDLSIEGILRTAVEKIQQHPVELMAASRTDTGVHAEGQVVTFKTPCLRKKPSQFLLSLNALLPAAIRVLDVSQTALSFHPTLDALKKEYHYFACYAPVCLPRMQGTTWHTPGDLNISLMQRAAALLIGTHDFSAFCNSFGKALYANTWRTLIDIEICSLDNSLIKFRVTGTNFLYKMVRNIVGTLVYIGRNKLSLEDLQRLIQGRKRSEAGITAPPHGLTLYQIFYKELS